MANVWPALVHQPFCLSLCHMPAPWQATLVLHTGALSSGYAPLRTLGKSLLFLEGPLMSKILFAPLILKCLYTCPSRTSDTNVTNSLFLSAGCPATHVQPRPPAPAAQALPPAPPVLPGLLRPPVGPAHCLSPDMFLRRRYQKMQSAPLAPPGLPSEPSVLSQPRAAGARRAALLCWWVSQSSSSASAPGFVLPSPLPVSSLPLPPGVSELGQVTLFLFY